MDAQQIQLKIDVFTPQTLSMSRLSDYLKPFAQMLGSEESVHFTKIDEGSAILIASVDAPAVPKIRTRAKALAGGTAPRRALKAYKDLDCLLKEDKGTAELLVAGEKLLEIDGCKRFFVEEFGPVRRNASIDGQLFSIGGKDETINVHLRDGGSEFKCVVSIDLAKRLAPHLLGQKLRLFGYGTWCRVDSAWQMTRFRATDFLLLNEASLDSTIMSIRKIFDDVSPRDFTATLSEMRKE